MWINILVALIGDHSSFSSDITGVVFSRRKSDFGRNFTINIWTQTDDSAKEREDELAQLLKVEKMPIIYYQSHNRTKTPDETNGDIENGSSTLQSELINGVQENGDKMKPAGQPELKPYIPPYVRNRVNSDSTLIEIFANRNRMKDLEDPDTPNPLDPIERIHTSNRLSKSTDVIIESDPKESNHVIDTRNEASNGEDKSDKEMIISNSDESSLIEEDSSIETDCSSAHVIERSTPKKTTSSPEPTSSRKSKAKKRKKKVKILTNAPEKQIQTNRSKPFIGTTLMTILPIIILCIILKYLGVL